MNDNWISVYSTGLRHLAEMAKQMLMDKDIPAVIVNKKDSSYLFGEIEVYVKGEDVIKAKFYIEQFEKNIKTE